ncbi:quinone oxidoreductase family protein [Halalkalibacter okhensis]|uniref:quinone oxidoreductase family protein n=1 Tax=Halalkalibacter okhensis TaxID=333138 RepID=UPI0027E3FCC0|nr:zinc-binding dehydrogenase [Halalkalibacter okhensis]
MKSRNGHKKKGSFPMVLGLDVAGIVEEAPRDSYLKKGDRVIAFPKFGSNSEYVIASEPLVFKVPHSLSLKNAAAIPTVSILSYMLLHEIAQVKTTDTIVVHSAAGGVGSMLVQLAKLAGVLTIFATVGSLNKKQFVEDLGADFVYSYEGFSEKVLRETNNHGANIIFDSVAGTVSEKSLECLALYGTLVQFGNSSGSVGTFKTSDLHSSCRNIKGFSLGTTRTHDPKRLAPAAAKVLSLFAENKLSIPIAAMFDLKHVAMAHQLMESRKHTGKILIKI